MTYVPPNFLTFKLRFPEFAAVPDDLVNLVMNDAFNEIGDNYLEKDRARAQMLLTAHMLSLEGEPERSMAMSKSVAVDSCQTNELLSSSALGEADWVSSRLTVNSNVASDPSGKLIMDKLEETNETGNHEIRQTITKPSGITTLNAQVIIKPDERDHAYLFVDQGSSSNRSGTRFELVGDGVKEDSFDNGSTNLLSSNIKKLDNGCYIISISVKVPTGQDDWGVAVRLYNGGQTYTGVVGEGLALSEFVLSYADLIPVVNNGSSLGNPQNGPIQTMKVDGVSVTYSSRSANSAGVGPVRSEYMRTPYGAQLHKLMRRNISSVMAV